MKRTTIRFIKYYVLALLVLCSLQFAGMCLSIFRGAPEAQIRELSFPLFMLMAAVTFPLNIAYYSVVDPNWAFGWIAGLRFGNRLWEIPFASTIALLEIGVVGLVQWVGVIELFNWFRRARG